MTEAVVRLLLPEIVLTIAAVAIYLVGTVPNLRGSCRWMGGAALAIAASALWLQQVQPASAEGLYSDALAYNGRWLAMGFGAILLLLASRTGSSGASEYTGSLLLTIVGLMLVVATGDLVLLFVALELISIPTYVLLYLGRRDVQSQESTIKYFFLSVLSSAILLYGFSFLYGVAGSPNFSAIREAAEVSPGGSTLLKLAVAMVFGGLCFKVAAVPFHFYAPDVYQGTSYPNAALLSVVPKAAGLAAMVRLLTAAMPGLEPYGWLAVLLVSVLTMTLGNTLALWQVDMRRLLAYSSIAHAGYMLIGLAIALAAGNPVGPLGGVAGLGLYLATYAPATVGAFALLEYLGGPDRRVDKVEELAGLVHTRPLPAAALAICLFSLAGVPVLAGFWAKLWLFAGALNVDGSAGGHSELRWWFTGLAIAGALNAAVAAAYYLRVVAVMYFRPSVAKLPCEGGRGAWCAALACTLLVVVIGLYPGPLMRYAQDAGIAISAERAGQPPGSQSAGP
jgi:NADH-quinone oxidoreductase subunit N